MSKAGVVVREVRDPNDPAIAGFGRMQRAAYFAPETLIPAEYIPRMISAGDSSARHNHLLVAEYENRVVGGTLFHWLRGPDVGFSSFMGVAREFRGRGIGRRMHQERSHILDLDSNGQEKGVFIDVVNPTRLTAEEVERDRRAGFDPWDRRRVFEHLGFRQVDIRYEQPVGGPGGGPVTNLDLLFSPREPTDSLPTELVVATMRAYWSTWLGDARARQYSEELGARANGATQLALISPVPAPGHPPY
jgi:GNAT superfamily N-acetyltransferase